jgi:DNA-binding transcriptional LysR family regulator
LFPDWKQHETTDRLRAVQVFVEVARDGSFTGAARRLGISKASVTKHVAALEHSLRALDDGSANLIAQGLDLSVRIAPALEDASYVAQPLAKAPQVARRVAGVPRTARRAAAAGGSRTARLSRPFAQVPDQHVALHRIRPRGFRAGTWIDLFELR